MGRNRKTRNGGNTIDPDSLGTYADEKLQLYQMLGTNDPNEIFNILSNLYTAHGLEIRNQLPLNPVGKKVPPAEKLASKLINRATAAADDWKEGALNPSRPAVDAAIAAKDKFVDRLTSAIKEGRWEGGLAATGEATRLEILRGTDPRTYSDGLSRREVKIRKVFGALQPQFQAVSDAIQAMPDKTDADREKRLIQARRLMLQVKKAGR